MYQIRFEQLFYKNGPQKFNENFLCEHENQKLKIFAVIYNFISNKTISIKNNFYA